MDEQIDIDLGYQMDGDCGFGDLIEDPNDLSGKPMVVSQDIDWKYRPQALADLNFIEFCCILQKYKLVFASSTSTSRTSNLFKDLASDNEEQVELEDQDSDDSDTGNAYPLQSVAKRVRGRGRTKTEFFNFRILIHNHKRINCESKVVQVSHI